MPHHNRLDTRIVFTWKPSNNKKEWEAIAERLTNLLEKRDNWVLVSLHSSEITPTPRITTSLHLKYEEGIDPVRFGDSPQGNNWCLYISTNHGVMQHYFSARDSDVNFILNIKEDRTIEILEGHWEHREFITEGYSVYVPQT